MNNLNKLLASLILLTPLASACGNDNTTVYGPNPNNNNDSVSEPLDVYGPSPYYCDTGDNAFCQKNFGDNWICGTDNNCVEKKADSNSDDDGSSDAKSDN